MQVRTKSTTNSQSQPPHHPELITPSNEASARHHQVLNGRIVGELLLVTTCQHWNCQQNCGHPYAILDTSLAMRNAALQQ